MTELRRPVPHWRTGLLFKVGDKVLWNGVRLVCCVEHFAHATAEHPWDPGAAGPTERAAALWAPQGEAEARKLGELASSAGWRKDQPQRLVACALMAAGYAKAV